MLFSKLKKLKHSIDYKELLVSYDIIKASHQRCLNRKVNAGLTQIPHILTNVEIDNLLNNSEPLLSIAWPVIKEDIYPNFVDEDQLIILCNYEGYAVTIKSSPKALQLCYSMNIGIGTCFREEVCGTNAIALSMLLKNTVVIKGEQHYCGIFKDWTCIAAPIRLPDGDIAGYLDVSIDSGDDLGHTLALIQLAVKYIEKMFKEKTLDKKLLINADFSPEEHHEIVKLSTREKEVLNLLAKGQTINEVGETLRISCETVKTYRKRIHKKLGVCKRIDCLNKARELGLLME